MLCIFLLLIRPGVLGAILRLIQPMLVGTLAANVFVTKHSRTKRRASNCNILTIFLMGQKAGVRLVCRCFVEVVVNVVVPGRVNVVIYIPFPRVAQ